MHSAIFGFWLRLRGEKVEAVELMKRRKELTVFCWGEDNGNGGLTVGEENDSEEWVVEWLWGRIAVERF